MAIYSITMPKHIPDAETIEDKITRITAATFGYEVGQIFKKTKPKYLVRARWVIAERLVFMGFTPQKAGEYLKIDRTTILYGLKMLVEELKTNKLLKNKYDAVNKRLEKETAEADNLPVKYANLKGSIDMLTKTRNNFIEAYTWLEKSLALDELPNFDQAIEIGNEIERLKKWTININCSISRLNMVME